MGWLEEYEAASGAPPGEEKPKDWLEEYEAAVPATEAEMLQQAGSRYGRGLAGVGAGVLQSAGLALEAVGAKSLAGADLGVGLQEYAEAVRQFANQALPEVERLRDSFLLSTAPEALGSSAGFLLPGGWLKAAGVPIWASTMSLGAAVQGAAMYEDARMHGAPDGDQWKAWLLGAGVGLTEAIPLSRILTRADKASGGTLKQALVHAVVEGGEEFLQESGSSLASNAIAGHILAYDEDRKLLEGVLESGGGGFFSGVILSALGTAAAHSASKVANRGTEDRDGRRDQGTRGEAAPAVSPVPGAEAEGGGTKLLPNLPVEVRPGAPSGAPGGQEGGAPRPDEAQRVPAEEQPAAAAVPVVRGEEESRVPPDGAGGAAAGATPVRVGPEAGGEAGPVPVPEGRPSVPAAPTPEAAPGVLKKEKKEEPLVYAHSPRLSDEDKKLVPEGYTVGYARRIPIADIEETQTKNFRSAIDEERVEKLMLAMTEGGAKIPPLLGMETPSGKVRLIEGHHRKEAAHRAGFEHVPIVVAYKTPTQKEDAAPRARLSDVAEALRGVTEAWGKGGAKETEEDLAPVDSLALAQRVLAQREAAGVSSELDETLKELVDSLSIPPDMGVRGSGDFTPAGVEARKKRASKEKAKTALAQAALEKAKALLAAFDATKGAYGGKERRKAPAPEAEPEAKPDNRDPTRAEVQGSTVEKRTHADGKTAGWFLRGADGKRLVLNGKAEWNTKTAAESARRLYEGSTGEIEKERERRRAEKAEKEKAKAEKPEQTPEDELAALEREFQAAGAKIRESRAPQSSDEVKGLRAAQDKIRYKLLTLQNEIELAKKEGREPRSLLDTLAGVPPKPKARAASKWERYTHFTLPERAAEIRTSGWRPTGRSPYRGGDDPSPNWYPERSLFLSLDPTFWGQKQVIRTGQGRRVYSKENREEFERLAAIEGTPVDFDYQKQDYYAQEGGSQIRELEGLEFEVDPSARRLVVKDLATLQALMALAKRNAPATKGTGAREGAYHSLEFWEAVAKELDIVEVRNARELGQRDGPHRAKVGGHWRFWDQMTADQLVVLNPLVARLVETKALPGKQAPPKTEKEKRESAWSQLARPLMLDLGRATTIELAGGKTLPANYGVLDANELIPSHDARRGFAPNAAGDINERKYDDPTEGKASRETVEKIAATLKPSILLSDSPTPTDGPPIVTSKGVVLGGNARAMAIQLAYQRDTDAADEYAVAVKRAADRFQVAVGSTYAGRPVLVRVVADGSEGLPGELSRILNEPLTTAKSTTTEAVSRGSLVTPEAATEIANALGGGTLRDALSDPGRSTTILRALVKSGAFSEGDLVALTDSKKGTPTQNGKQTIEDTLLGAVVTDVRVLAETPPSTRQAILKALPALVRIKVHHPAITLAMTHAAQGMATLKESGQPLDDALKQQVLPGVDVAWKGDRLAVGIMRALVDEAPTKVAARFQEAADRIDDEASGQASLFTSESMTPQQRLEREFGLTDAEQGGLVEEDEDIDDEPSGGAVALDPSETPTDMQTGYPADPVMGGGANLGGPIGGRLFGSLKPAAPAGKGKVSQPQIIEALSKVVAAVGGKTPIRWGRLGTKQARGVFKVGPEVIRVLQANNVSTAAHEVGHALEKHVYGWDKGGPWKKPLIAKPLQKELVALGKALYGNTKPAGGYKREGFAEFIRLYTMEPGTAAASAPKFHGWFEGAFLAGNPEVKKALLKVRELAETWKQQGSIARAEASMVEPTSAKEKLKALKARVTADALIEALVEQGRPASELAREAERRMGKVLEPSQDPFQVFQALRTTHSARTKQMVESNMIDLAGNPVGPPLADIRPLVRGRYHDFVLYLWAQRAKALLTDPKGAPRQPGLSLQDAQEIIDTYDSPAFQRAADMVYQWADGVLNYAAQASPEFAGIVEKIRARDPGYYIPLQREFDALDSLWGDFKKKKGLAGSGSITKRLKGSGRRIKNPFPALIANAEKTVLAAHRRLFLDSVFRLAQVEGLGHILEEVPVDQVPVASIQVKELLERLRQKAGIPPNEGGIELQATGLHEGEDLTDLLGETLTFFAPAQFPKGQDPVIPRWVNGQVRWYALNHKLAGMLAGMDVYRLPWVLDLILGVPARAFRLGTTGLRASFSLVTNPTRDFQVLYQNTRSSAWAPRLFMEWVKQVAVAGVHHATGGKVSSPWLDAFVNLGGEMAQPLGMDMDHTARAARRLFQGRAVRILDPRNMLDFVRQLLQFPETASRVTELRLLAKEIGVEQGKPMTLDQSLQLLLASKQATVDFTAAGWLMRVWNQAVPFANAPVQGMRASVRAGRRAPGRFFFRGLQFTALTLGLWWLYKDEDWYRELSARTRALFWAFKIKWNGRDELVLIPRAQEGPMFFGSMPEALADAWYRQDPKSAREFFSVMFETLTPSVQPVVVRETLEQALNRDLFWNTPIVPQGELRRPAEEQYGEYTTDVAKFLGDLFNVSPRRIDHAIRGTFGGVARDVVDVVGLGGSAQETGGEPSDIPVLGRLFQRGGPLGVRPQSIDKLYDAIEEADQLSASTKVEESREQRQRRLMLEDAGRAVSALSYVRSQTSDVDERRELTRKMVELARRALQDAQREAVIRGPMQQERRQAERREQELKR